MEATYHLLESRSYPASLSLVIPMYNEESVVDSLRADVDKFLTEVKCETEILLVNDGSSDRTLALIAAWAAADRRIKIIHLSRNFGHQAAVSAGLDYARGDAIVADGRRPSGPSLGDSSDDRELLRRLRRSLWPEREAPWRTGPQALHGLAILPADARHGLPGSSVGHRRLPPHIAAVPEGLQSMRETHRFLRGMVAWVGYPQCAVKYERAPRAGGQSKYPLRKMLLFAWTAATSFSILPLQASLLLGILVGLLGIEEGIRALLAVILGWYTVPGWTSLMIVTCIIGSALLICIGILGQYVGKIYEQSKERPLYLVSRTFNISQVKRAAGDHSE